VVARASPAPNPTIAAITATIILPISYLVIKVKHITGQGKAGR
jgi:hypothetical protein